MSTGFWYADKGREEHGDYAKLAFLPFGTLELEIVRGCPPAFAEQIKVHAAIYQQKRGEKYQISTSGQTITLGYAKLDK